MAVQLSLQHPTTALPSGHPPLALTRLCSSPARMPHWTGLSGSDSDPGTQPSVSTVSPEPRPCTVCPHPGTRLRTSEVRASLASHGDPWVPGHLLTHTQYPKPGPTELSPDLHPRRCHGGQEPHVPIQLARPDTGAQPGATCPRLMVI